MDRGGRAPHGAGARESARERAPLRACRRTGRGDPRAVGGVRLHPSAHRERRRPGDAAGGAPARVRPLLSRLPTLLEHAERRGPRGRLWRVPIGTPRPLRFGGWRDPGGKSAPVRAPGGPGGGPRLFASLLQRATGEEADFLIRLVLGELRQGALAGLMEEALAKATEI